MAAPGGGLDIPGALALLAALGGAAGALLHLTARRRGPGCIGEVTIGIAGALASGFVAPSLGLAVSRDLFSGVVSALAGAALALLLSRLARRR